MEGLWTLGKLSGPHWLCPLCGPAPGSIPRALSQGCRGREVRGASLSSLPLLLPPEGEGLNQQHWRQTGLLAVSQRSGLESLASEDKGMGDAERQGGDTGLLWSRAHSVLLPRSTGPLQRRSLNSKVWKKTLLFSC